MQIASPTVAATLADDPESSKGASLMLDSFINSRLHKRPDAKLSVKAMRAAFLETLPVRERPLWPRWKLLEALQAMGFVVAKDASNITCVAGLSFDPAPRWVRDATGRLNKET